MENASQYWMPFGLWFTSRNRIEINRPSRKGRNAATQFDNAERCFTHDDRYTSHCSPPISPTGVYKFTPAMTNCDDVSCLTLRYTSINIRIYVIDVRTATSRRSNTHDARCPRETNESVKCYILQRVSINSCSLRRVWFLIAALHVLVDVFLEGQYRWTFCLRVGISGEFFVLRIIFMSHFRRPVRHKRHEPFEQQQK